MLVTFFFLSYSFSNLSAWGHESQVTCCVRLPVTLWIIARQARLSMGFSRQKYWSGLSCPPLNILEQSQLEPPDAVATLLGIFNVYICYILILSESYILEKTGKDTLHFISKDAKPRFHMHEYDCTHHMKSLYIRDLCIWGLWYLQNLPELIPHGYWGMTGLSSGERERNNALASESSWLVSCASASNFNSIVNLNPLQECYKRFLLYTSFPFFNPISHCYHERTSSVFI